jgi:hypothetical protein
MSYIKKTNLCTNISLFTGHIFVFFIDAKTPPPLPTKILGQGKVLKQYKRSIKQAYEQEADIDESNQLLDHNS